MKKINKFSLLLIVLIISFIVGINKVYAKDNITCIYSLPFTGINPSTGRYYKMQDNFPCNKVVGDTGFIDCSLLGQVSALEPSYEDNQADSFITVFGINPSLVYDEFIDSKNTFYGYGYHNSSNGILLFGATDSGLNCPDIYTCENQSSEYDNPEDVSYLYIKESDTVCPKYIQIKMSSVQLSHAYLVKLYNWATENAKSTFTFDHLYFGPAADEIEDAKTIAYKTTTEDEYKNSLKNFNNISTQNSGDNGFTIKGDLDETTLYNNAVLTLIGFKGNADSPSNSAIIEEGAGIFRDIVTSAWVDLINKQLTNMKTNCGKDFGKYINLKNYKADVPASGTGLNSKSYDFVDYATNASYYNNKKLTSADKSIDSKCWNSRSDFMNAYKSFRAFMYSIGATTNGDVDFEIDDEQNKVFAKAILKDNDVKHASNNIVYNWDSLVCFFRFIRYGEDDDDFSKCTSGNEAVEKKKTDSKNVVNTSYAKDLFYKDRCAYKCFGTMTSEDMLSKTNNWFQSQYHLCNTPSTGMGSAKNDGASYNDCITAMSECGGYTYTEKENLCKNHTGGSGNDFTECMKSYDISITNSTTFDACMDEKIPNFSTQSKEMYENAKSAYDKAVEEYTVTETYKFESADLLRFKYGLKKYTPKCKDITFLTSAWNVIIVLAPFLLIIYTAFDYFKVVMAGDEEKMKVTKKKIPRRVIALVILLVFPAILKMLVTKFGTHGSQNTKYIRCILSRDYGENEDDDEDESKDSKDEEAKDN